MVASSLILSILFLQLIEGLLFFCAASTKASPFFRPTSQIALIDLCNAMNDLAKLPKLSKLDGLLETLLHKYEHDANYAGCRGGSDLQLPSLQNEILPISGSRWVLSGPDQHTKDIYQPILPALRLASRFLQENYPLLWFSVLTFGEQRQSPEREQRILSTTAYHNSQDAAEKVKLNLQELGEVVTIMFVPRSAKETAYGITYRKGLETPFSNEFTNNNWPQMREKCRLPAYRRRKPRIVMNRDSRDHLPYQHVHSSTVAKNRLMFVIAVTLVHEVAHAYHMLLGKGRDPLWSRNDIYLELGSSREQRVLGGMIGEGFRMLFSMDIIAYINLQARDYAFKYLTKDDNPFHTKASTDGKVKNWPVLDADSFRGSELCIDGRCQQYLAAIQAVSVKWIIAWFREEEWVERRQH
ncbi:hypothetical protein EK21DRAFT_84673 [Setomelanomma holmii]|uniref:Metalloprotease n=1 Tax=Setomelanomma holmii TaxID=210430 RepID=A0A9P4HME7_9PLEO|nr:hypothetical protein EK21DRAFT_84673 [Setomelanomma holmii]